MTFVPQPAGEPPQAHFAHASEAELARILDFYEVRWRYEPDTFPIGWSLDGDVVESFAPDFYLPDLELYVELTTLKQSLVRKKNRKLRRLRELYPDVRIKLFYARDFRMLLLKFGRLALADELSGTVGQATPPRGQRAGALGPVVDLLPRPGTIDGVDDAVTGDLADDRVVAGLTTAQPVVVSAEDIVAAPAAAHAPKLRGRRRGRRHRAAVRAAEAARLGAAGEPEPA